MTATEKGTITGARLRVLTSALWRLGNYLPTIAAVILMTVLIVAGTDTSESFVATPNGRIERTPDVFSSAQTYNYDHGWPWSYAVRRTNHAGRFSLTRGTVESLFWPAMLGDIAVAVAIVGIVGLLSVYRCRRRGGLWIFTVRELLLSLLFSGIALASWRASAIIQQREQIAVATLKESGIYFGIEYCGPTWLEKLIGKERLAAFWRNTSVSFLYADVPEDMSQLACFRHIRSASFLGSGIEDQDVRRLYSKFRLATIEAEDTDISIAALAELGGNDVRSLAVVRRREGVPVGPDVTCLAALQSLRTLRLNGFNLSDANLQAIGRLTDLQELDLNNCQLSTVGLHYLESLKNLRDMQLYDTDLTPASAYELKSHMPWCTIGSNSTGAVD